MSPSQSMQQSSATIGGTTFGYSGVGVDELESLEYTIVVIALDTSPSVSPFRQQIEDGLKEIVEKCRKLPRADNLLLRVITFDSRLGEIHGFRELMSINPSDYTGQVKIVGHSTKLYDAAVSSVSSADDYGRRMYKDEDLTANAIVFVITDGLDNDSTCSMHAVKDALDKARGVHGGPDAKEGLESVLSILIGVNTPNQYVKDYLDKFNKDVGFDQYADLDHIPTLVAFVSQSISSQSQSLGTGGPSQTVDPSSLAI